MSRKSTWPDPNVQGLMTRQKAARDPKPEPAKSKKEPVKRSAQSGGNTPSPTGNGKGGNVVQKRAQSAIASKTTTPAPAKPTVAAKDDAAHKTGTDKIVAETGTALSPPKSQIDAEKKTDTDTDTDAEKKTDTDTDADVETKTDANKKTKTDANKKTKTNTKEKSSDTDTDTEEKTDASGDGEGSDVSKSLDFDLSFLDDDLFAAALNASDDEDVSSVPGPLPAPLQAIWDTFLDCAADFIVKFSGASRKTTEILWRMFGDTFKLTRNPNIYNMWVKKWSLLNGMDEGETKREYHRRYVEAYHTAMDEITPEKKKELRMELIDWLRSYEAECAKEAERRGHGFKGMLDTKQTVTRTVQHLGRKNNCVIWGVIVPLNYGDAKAVAASGSFCSHDGMTTVLKELGVNVDDFCGDIAVGFGAKNLANRLVDDWSDAALFQVLKKCIGDRRFYLRRGLLAILNTALDVPTDTLTWKGNASDCVKRGIWYDKWPAGIDPPDVVGDNKYLDLEHNKLMEACYKTLRKEPGFAFIEVNSFTDEQLSWRRKDWKRWCALPVYRDTNGKVLIRVGDVMPSEEMDIKLKGRAPRVRITDAKKPSPGETAVPLEDDDSVMHSKTDNEDARAIARLVAPTLKTKRPRRSEEEYSEMLVGGGTDGYWDVTEPAFKRRAVPRPGYKEVDEMDVVDDSREPSAGPSNRGDSAQPALTLDGLQQQMLVSQRHQMLQSQQMMAGMLQQLLGRGVMFQQQQQPMASANWAQQQQHAMAQQINMQQLPIAQQQQQGGLPSLDDWLPDGQGGFLPLNKFDA